MALCMMYRAVCIVAHSQVSFYQVARALTIVFNIAFSFAILGQSTSRRAVGCCAVVRALIRSQLT